VQRRASTRKPASTEYERRGGGIGHRLERQSCAACGIGERRHRALLIDVLPAWAYLGGEGSDARISFTVRIALRYQHLLLRNQTSWARHVRKGMVGARQRHSTYAAASAGAKAGLDLNSAAIILSAASGR